LRTVTIQFTRPKGFKPLSWAIRKVQRTDYSHVRLTWLGMGEKIPVIYEASGSYLKFIGPIAAKSLHVEVVDLYNFELSQDQYRATVALCMENAGIEYGKRQLVGMGIAKMFGLKKNPYGDGAKTQVCSEIVGHFLNDILGWQTELDLDIAGPKEIRETIIKFKQEGLTNGTKTVK